MPTFDTPKTTHTFNHPPDPLFGIDPITIQIPGDGYFTDAVGINMSSKRGSIQVTGKPSTGSMGQQTVYVSWQLAPVPGSFVTYGLTVSYHRLDDAQGRVVVFEDRDFGGRSLVVDNKITYAELNAQGFNDLTSSIVVLNGDWIFYTDDLQHPYVNGNNVATVLGPGMYRWVEDCHITNDDMSSFRCVRPAP